jgi:hypothetical protein
MIGGAIRTAAAAALGIVVLTAFFARGSNHPLDPDDPIAADGSMIAGRAHTLYDTEPALGAFRMPPRSDSDNPADFAPLIKADRPTIEFDRALFKRVLTEPLDSSLCKEREHRMLLLAVRSYYGERGREKRTYTLRGPLATAAFEREWSTPADRDIDNYVGHAVQYGLLHKSEMSNDPYGEFAITFADTQEVGTGCTAADNR